MITACRFRVYYKALVVFIFLATFKKFCFLIFRKIVFVHKVLTCVVRRVYTNYFDFTIIRFLQNLQHFQIFAFNKEVFGCVKVDGFLRRGLQGGCGGLLQYFKGIRLSRPIQYITYSVLSVRPEALRIKQVELSHRYEYKVTVWGL